MNIRKLFSGSERNNLIIDLLVLIFIFAFIFNFFEPKLLFLKTTINGGDTGSHYSSAVYLKEVLFPKWKIMGWMQGNYAGFPLFYHYFPLPFILMSFLSFFISMEVSFKLITILGTLLLPLFAYLAFRAMKYEFPVPIFAAVFTLPFLFNQGNSMWGGNIPSTLAGEFCYSLGFAFLILFFGTLYRGAEKQKFLVLNAILIFLIGFSHAYTLIFALLLGIFFAIGDFKRNFKYLFKVYGLGFLFLAFWLIPVLGNVPYTTSFVFRWTINSLLEVFPVVIIPYVFISIWAFFYNIKDKRTCYFLYSLAACVFVYLIGPRIGILDIRIVPFFQALLVLFGAALIQTFVKELKFLWVLPVAIFFATAVWTDINATYIRSWIKWNYSGYEQKKTWETFKSINDYLRSSGNGRVEWEHTPLDEALGSIRSSETLPHFAKRQTLEGIHMLGAISAPFVFYIESETSYQPCNPIPSYYYSTLDLKRGIDHFKMFNVSHFVARSTQVKDAIKRFPEFKLEKTAGEYQIYRLLTNSGKYVEPLSSRPILFLTNNWRDISYKWFSTKRLNGVHLVFKKSASPDDGNVGASPEDKRLFGKAVSDLSDVEMAAIDNKNVRVISTIENESILIETSKIGHPLLIKVSYHPNWKVYGADKVYFASPSFMLVFPKEHKVQLVFERGRREYAGLALTAIGIFLAAFLARRL